MSKTMLAMIAVLVLCGLATLMEMRVRHAMTAAKTPEATRDAAVQVLTHPLDHVVPPAVAGERVVIIG